MRGGIPTAILPRRAARHYVQRGAIVNPGPYLDFYARRSRAHTTSETQIQYTTRLPNQRDPGLAGSAISVCKR